MPHVFIVSEGDDIGGVGTAIVRAVKAAQLDSRDRREEYWTVRSMRGSDNYIGYPADLTWNWDKERFNEEYEKADLIHAMERTANVLGARGISIDDRITAGELATVHDKPYVLHHHGSALRWSANGGANMAQIYAYAGVPQICSTIDLELIHPSIRWMPNPIPVNFLREFGERWAPGVDEPFTVAHTPTFRSCKGTDVYLEGAKLAGVPVRISEKTRWETSLTTKARSHAYMDQLIHGFGLSALETWAMYKPVISSAADPAIIAHMKKRWGNLPFMYVDPTPESIALALTTLRDDLTSRRYWSNIGNTFVRNYHDEALIGQKLIDLWSKTIRDWKKP